MENAPTAGEQRKTLPQWLQEKINFGQSMTCVCGGLWAGKQSWALHFPIALASPLSGNYLIWQKIRISILPTPPHHHPLLLQLNGAWRLWTQYFTRVGSKGGPFLLSSSYQQRKPLTSAKSHTTSWAQHIQPSELCGVQPVKYEPWILESRNLIKGRRGSKTVCIISGGRLLLHSLMRAYFYLSNSTTAYH